MKVTGIIILLCLSLVGYSVRIKSSGIPSIQNFHRLDYNGGPQNWAIAQSNDQLMYFANYGLLEFDGTNWQMYALPNGSNIRSVLVDNDRIYVGAFDEFGYFEYNNNGNLQYHSLAEKLPPNDRNFDNIWKIHKVDSGIVFQSFYGLFQYNDDQIIITRPASRFHFSYQVNDIIFVFDEEEGLMSYKDWQVHSLPGGNFFKGVKIWSLLPVNEKDVLVGTAENGLFIYDGINFSPWKCEANEQLKKDQIFCGVTLGEQYFAFGTIQNGLLITTKEGKIVNHINREKGLQNNTILSLFQDREGNLWLGLDNGIDLIEINSPISFFQEYYNLGTGYDAILFNDNLYLGTNQGLYVTNWDEFNSPKSSKDIFKPVKNINGQVWSLNNIDGELLCAHNNGLFRIDGDIANSISSEDGAWICRKVPNKPDYMITGNYGGLSLYKKEKKNWKFEQKIEGFSESSRLLEFDNKNRLWMAHGFIGIFRIELNDSLNRAANYKLYSTNDGLPTNQFISLYKINDEILFSTNDGIYQYDDRSDRFIPHGTLNKGWDDLQGIGYLYTDSRQNIWFSRNNRFGILRRLDDGSYTRIEAPFTRINELAIQGFENIREIDRSYILFGIEDGFAHYTPDFPKNYSIDFNVRIKTMGLSKSNIEINGKKFELDSTFHPEIKFRENDVWFDYSATFFEGEHHTLYSYKLEGNDLAWSDWTSSTYKEYTNLRGGDYTFYVKAKNIFNKESKPAIFSFTILPPWYRSNWAYIGYAVSILLILLLLRFIYRRNIERSKQKEKEQQRKKYQEREMELKQTALIAEKEAIRLRNEKLRNEMIHKEKELANSTMNIIQKNKFLTHIKTDLKKIYSDAINPSVKNKISSIVRKIDKDIDNEKQWEVFETHFEGVHEEFLKRIQLLYPNLGPKELKLSAYLRMNMSTKEIATLMNISVRGVEISRYRLRKKMNIDRSVNLTEKLMKI